MTSVTTSASSKSKKRASIGMRALLADGSYFELGTISNIPVLKWFQKRMYERRLKQFKQIQAQRAATLQSNSGV